MSHRYEFEYIERTARRVKIHVDFPQVVKSDDFRDAVAVARRMVVQKIRERENDPFYYPDLQSMGSHYLGEVPDEQQDSAAQRESSSEVQPTGQESTGAIGGSTVAGGGVGEVGTGDDPERTV
jgi:hypothetical protein